MSNKVWMNSDPCRFRKISKLKPRPKKKLARTGCAGVTGNSVAQEIVSQRQDFLGNNVAPQSIFFPCQEILSLLYYADTSVKSQLLLLNKLQVYSSTYEQLQLVSDML